MNEYRIIVLGASGAGKTVYLGSLFNKLSIIDEKIGFSVKVPPDQRIKLNKHFYTVAYDIEWPASTLAFEEWDFTCQVEDSNGNIFPVIKFKYLDYAGGLLTDETGAKDAIFRLQEEAESADAILVLLDGHKIYNTILGQPTPGNSIYADLDNLLAVVADFRNPFHFVITKWDIFTTSSEEAFVNFQSENDLLIKVRRFLWTHTHFRNIIQGIIRRGSIARLVPISSVGHGFVTLTEDGLMEKNEAKLPEPFQVEMPFACILPDSFQTHLEKMKQIEQAKRNENILVEAELTLKEYISQIFGGGLRTVTREIPLKFQFAEPAMRKLSDTLTRSADEKEKDAAEKTAILRKERDKSLKKIKSNETATEHAIVCFGILKRQLENNFPASDLTKQI